MPSISLLYLNAPDIERIALSDDEILSAVEQGLIAQGNGQAVIEPRVHLTPDPVFRGHFNILRGYVAPVDLAGVKIVGDFLDNYEQGLPSEMALLNLFDPRTGMPRAILDATAITEMRTGALTALGAKYLARKNSTRLGHVGARGTSYWNVRLLDRLFDFSEIRVHSRRPESRQSFASRLENDLRKKIIVTDNWRDCLSGADIMVEASRLEVPVEHFKRDFVKRGSLVIPYGTVSALELSLPAIMDKIVIDDFGQFRAGKLGALRPHIDQGLVSEETVYAELAEIVVGKKPGRERDDETILFWHRGLSLSDISLAAAMLRRAQELNIGQNLAYS
ncbi:MAG TPA: ornithine cyclodeaminase family protein [Aestuariivirgaceae bacterium]|jgi:ornithine cyclodeaminase